MWSKTHRTGSVAAIDGRGNLSNWGNPSGKVFEVPVKRYTHRHHHRVVVLLVVSPSRPYPGRGVGHVVTGLSRPYSSNVVGPSLPQHNRPATFLPIQLMRGITHPSL